MHTLVFLDFPTWLGTFNFMFKNYFDFGSPTPLGSTTGGSDRSELGGGGAFLPPLHGEVAASINDNPAAGSFSAIQPKVDHAQTDG